MKCKAIIILTVAAAVFTAATAYAAEFTDVPANHWAYSSISRLSELGITEGLGDGRFGVDDGISRAQFTAFLCKLYKWDTTGFTGGSAFSDNNNQNQWYYGFVEAAAKNGAIAESAGNFRPNDAITREEMAVMVVRSLGFGELGGQISKSPFNDVTANAGYITLAQDFGIIRGVGDNKFLPRETATRAHAAVMITRMHDRMNAKTDFLNGFYAIRSAGQMDFISGLDCVSYGWSRLEWDNKPVLNMTSANNNEYGMPAGYEEPLKHAKNTALLMVAVRDEMVSGISLTDYIVSDERLRAAAIDAIAEALSKYPRFDGVVIDFEGMKGERLKNDFIKFLTSLRGRLDGKIHVAVHPKPKQGEYFDAYDYAAIGELADKVILMAHDYHAKRMTEAEMAMNITTTPLAPIDQVYYSLKAITDEKTGVRDHKKIVLQISFDTVQWQSKNGGIINNVSYNPTYDALVSRMRSDGVINYSKKYESPYVTYTADGVANTIWYEDARSVDAKRRLAKMFGITGLSLWRLGNVPEYPADLYLNVWSTVRAGR